MPTASTSAEIHSNRTAVGQASPADTTDGMASAYEQLVAPVTKVLVSSSTRLFKMDANVLSLASPEQIGKTVDGITLTAEVVARNRYLLGQIASHCRADGIGIIVEGPLDLSPQSDWTYRWLDPATTADLPIVQVENNDLPKVNDLAIHLARKVGQIADIVTQIAGFYPDVKIGRRVSRSSMPAVSLWATYNCLAKELAIPGFSYVVVDPSQNALLVTLPIQWRDWLHCVSTQVQNLGMTLAVLVDGPDGHAATSKWTAQAEQHAATLAQVAGVTVNTILARGWQNDCDNARSPFHNVATIADRAYITAMTLILWIIT